jgi:surfeit locus 1 family protein
MTGRHPAPKHSLIRWLASLAGLIALVGFIALGNWQLERRSWKLDLMEQVNTRVHAAAVTAPGPDSWPSINKQSHEYLHVSVQGRFLADNTTLVVAATELGSGYWVLTPLQRQDGSIVLINRGYIGQGVEAAPPPEGELKLSGLLRLSEANGSVLRDNSPATGRWYSRDVAAIAAVHNLTAAPYFIDAAAGEAGSAGGFSSGAEGGFSSRAEGFSGDTEDPVGGLTILRFHNNHLGYALTWYCLALMVIGAGVIVTIENNKAR